MILHLMLVCFALNCLHVTINKGTYICTDYVVIKVEDLFCLLDKIYVLFKPLDSFIMLSINRCCKIQNVG
ncbi:hypothetical protein ES319_A08G169000v1 [Gossypium barbadense]|uniref:Secreted protein n=1 Tax=Gossypium barbadense TaxID=3634 RepID=A0A5J5UT26_GOSBA|nr:hypothetical protein ES319_A08G169000v1 [Gossypium barbadense]